jgi:uncharacterized protein YcbK (DUF882 family)
MPNDVLTNVIKLANEMQIIRDYFNKPIKINSSYRSVDYNKTIGGAKSSQHILGKACDFNVIGLTPDTVVKGLLVLIENKSILNGGLGRYNTFTHYDIRGKKARWDNRV